MNHDTNREDRIEHAPPRYYVDIKGLGWFGCNVDIYNFLRRPSVICGSCGAKAESAETLPCGH